MQWPSLGVYAPAGVGGSMLGSVSGCAGLSASHDPESQVAHARGSLVAEGDKPVVGRNAGARLATGDELDDDFIAAALRKAGAAVWRALGPNDTAGGRG